MKLTSDQLEDIRKRLSKDAITCCQWKSAAICLLGHVDAGDGAVRDVMGELGRFVAEKESRQFSTIVLTMGDAVALLARIDHLTDAAGAVLNALTLSTYRNNNGQRITSSDGGAVCSDSDLQLLRLALTTLKQEAKK
jgi:hypothetical protein